MRTMKTSTDIRLEALARVEGIAWDENPDTKFLLTQIQATLYEMDQMLDRQTEDVYGSDQYPLRDEESPYPNPRRV